jgi:hypothetical protein
MKRRHVGGEEEPLPKVMKYESQLFPNDCLLSVYLFCDASQMAHTIPKVSLAWKQVYKQYKSLMEATVLC